MKNIETKILSIVLVILAVFIFVNGRYENIENIISLDQSSVSYIDIEMDELYEDLNGRYSDENDIAEITKVLRNLKVLEYKAKDTTPYTEEPLNEYKMIIYYTDSNPPKEIMTVNSRYAIIYKAVYKIKNGKELSRIYDIISERRNYVFTSLAEDLIDWFYSLGGGMKYISVPENRNVVAYVNGIPVYEDEIMDRIEKNEAISNDMGNSAPLPWGSDPFEYVYKEKFMMGYARKNGIDVSKEELEEQISFEKSSRESEDSREILEQYLSDKGITEEEFYNEAAPPSYVKSILKTKVRNYILTNLRKTEITNGEQQKYLDEFFEKNIKVVEVDKDFIKKYSE
ncbi:SurA N-terminal domain-containing protein [Sedimentibacter sp.]|uniref:SurA N-terminal domain-containing protein n=1 Tax=Sedimentibacter sp. TaxID=1960295 RepID=UPI0028A61F98|nr:SurA N-terminal domain-containing protein [Sedimentibacter sp.]